MKDFITAALPWIPIDLAAGSALGGSSGSSMCVGMALGMIVGQNIKRE